MMYKRVHSDRFVVVMRVFAFSELAGPGDPLVAGEIFSGSV
jgi:hypothetical protein